MRKSVLMIMIFAFGFANSQTTAYKGNRDMRAQVGANFQNMGTGIQASLDYGLGESFSIGAQFGYLLGFRELTGITEPAFLDRFDAKARVNANLGGVIGLPSNIDIYPGLDLGLKNFGGHAGVRYFFSKGFGLFSEIQFPIARYKKDITDYEYMNNQVNITLGASFDISR